MKYTLLIAFVIYSISAVAQPQAINYQGVARNTYGLPLINRSISLRLSILDSSPIGQVVYMETQNVSTSNSGLFNVEIGLGTVNSGSFVSIQWGLGSKWLKTEIDTFGGSNYLFLGTTQFLSVPYSLYSKSSGNGLPAGNYTGDLLYWNGTVWATVATGNPGDILTLSSSNIPTWGKPSFIISVGDFYQGGIVAYVLRPGDPGYDTNTQHGFIIPTFDQSTQAQWGCFATALPGADGNAIGTGNQNTIDIINGCTQSNIAARICYDLVFNGYNDWFLPSKDELNKLYLNRIVVGSFTNASYWSSSENGTNGSAFSQDFTTGVQTLSTRTNTFRVRAVRVF